MKFALLGDTHFSYKGEEYYEFMEKFYGKVFFPYLVANNIKVVIQTGDLFDKHNLVDINAVDFARRVFLNRFEELGIELHCFPGNHDIANKNKIVPNSLQVVINGTTLHNNIHQYHEPTYCQIGSYGSCLFVPWICKGNVDEVMESLSRWNESETYVFGHFELGGFAMSKNTLSKDDGKDESLRKKLSKFKHVYSGHYHSKSTQGNITYVGTPYELTWADCDDPKGFHILDTKSNDLEFIVNPYRMYQKVEYDGITSPVILQDTHIRLYVKQQCDTKKLDKFVSMLSEQESAKSVSIIQDYSVTVASDDGAIGETAPNLSVMNEDGSYVVENTTGIIEKYIDSNPVLGVSSDALKLHMTKLHKLVNEDN